MSSDRVAMFCGVVRVGGCWKGVVLLTFEERVVVVIIVVVVVG